MWKVSLLVVVFSCAQAQSMDCSNNAAVQSKPVSGPSGVSAVLMVASSDDHSKDSHQCMVDYSLRINTSNGAGSDDFFSSDGEYGRKLSVHLDGFSGDGKHIFGVISEGDRNAMTIAVDYDMAKHHAEVISIQDGAARLRAAKCGTTFAVAGTTDSGGIVVEPNTTDSCRSEHRWLLNRAGKLQNLGGDTTIVNLYQGGAR